MNWVLYSVYLSEKIGYWRYILIDRHLKANLDNAFAPLFDFFEPWCQDENCHGDIFNMLIRRWPGLNSGLRGRLLSRFFLWSVFLTHSLTVCERGFDEAVLRQPNRTARRAFPVVFMLDEAAFSQLRDQLVDTYRQLKAAQGQPLRRLRLQVRFAGLLLHQFLQPMEASGLSASRSQAVAPLA